MLNNLLLQLFLSPFSASPYQPPNPRPSFTFLAPSPPQLLPTKTQNPHKVAIPATRIAEFKSKRVFKLVRCGQLSADTDTRQMLLRRQG